MEFIVVMKKRVRIILKQIVVIVHVIVSCITIHIKENKEHEM